MSALVEGTNDGRQSPVDTVLPNVMERSIMNFNIIKEIPIVGNNNEYQKSIQYKWFGRIYDHYSFEDDTMDKLRHSDEEFYKQLDGILAEVKDEMKLKYKKEKEIKQIDKIPNNLLRVNYPKFFRPIGMDFLTKLISEEGIEDRRRKREDVRSKIVEMEGYSYFDEIYSADEFGNIKKRKRPPTTGGKRKKRRTKKKRRKRNLKKRTRRRRRKSKRRRRR